MKANIITSLHLDSTKTNIQVEKADLRGCGHTCDGVEDQDGVKRLRVICDADEYFFTKLTLRSILTLWDAEIASEDEQEVSWSIKGEEGKTWEMHCYFNTTLSWETYMQAFHS
jgi:hypothetical protein